VSVASGKVTLTGSVDSWTERRFAVRAARSVPGVLDVRDALSIAYAEPRTDDDIRRDVERRLAWDVRSRAGLVEVDVKQGNVRLHGVVGSAAEREHAYELAWVAGVRGVDADGLKIRWWAVDRMRRFDPRSQSDEEIAAAVRDALTLDPRVSRLGISVDVSEGVVTLTGAVSSARSRQIAREDAGNVVGVRRVYDLLVVVADGPPGDAEIQRRVAAALAADPYLSRHRLDVAVRDGEVRLSGSVNSAFDRRRAEALAGGMLGVKDVSLALEIVRSGEPVGDPELAERVRDALFWDARIAEERIRVEVADGAVTLRGWTDDPRERTLAEEKAARSGARSVRNEIEVKPERRP
jgi:osmotically-inducible protein OsmY